MAKQTEVDRITAQRDRAWRALMHIEDKVTAGVTDPMALAFHVANAHGLADVDEWNQVYEVTHG